MKKVKLNDSIGIDLQNLLNTRLLVQANSGGGKSWLLRRLLEQSHGQVQQIVIDLEGEFGSLREKYDYILAGKGGDTPAEPRNAAMLAKKLLEFRVSAIVDLYELHAQERKHFVKLFLDALVNAPKELWHPVLVVVDEAHVFCPEKGQSEAMESVIDLATRGRKRGFCAVLATQRISKLHKDAAAECNNKLIGRTGLDIDMKRASEELGFNSKDQMLSLRKLEAGEFFAFGPAISNEVVKLKVGEVQTTHPKAGDRIFTKSTPPTEKIKEVLKRIGDLPKEAEKEAHTIADYQSQIRDLQTEVRVAKLHRCSVAPSQEIVEKSVNVALRDQKRRYDAREATILKNTEALADLVEGFSKQAGKLLTFPIISVEVPKLMVQVAKLDKFYGPSAIDFDASRLKKENIEKNLDIDEIYKEMADKKPLTGGALRMLQVLVSRYPMKLTKVQLGTFARLKSRSGTFSTYLSALRSFGYVESNDGHLFATQEGIDYLGQVPMPPQSSEEVISQWKAALKGGARRMFEVLVENSPLSLTKEELGERTGLASTSGTFGTYLSMLRSNGLAEVSSEGVKASEHLFL